MTTTIDGETGYSRPPATYRTELTEVGQHFENLVDPYHVPILRHTRPGQIPQHALFTDTGRGLDAGPKEPLADGTPLFFHLGDGHPDLADRHEPVWSCSGRGLGSAIDDTHFRGQADREGG